MANAIRLSASQIRYLLVMKKMSETDKEIKSQELAKKLGVTKPSVHSMINILSKMNLVRKDNRAPVFFTSEGLETAKRYSEYYQAISLIFTDYISKEDCPETVIYYILAELSDNSLEQIRCKIIM